MLSFLTKKKLAEDKLANIVVNATLNLVDEAFADVAQMINEDPDLVLNPDIKPYDYDKFLLIVISGNLELIPKYFHDYQDTRLNNLMLHKFASALGVEHSDLKRAVSYYQSFFSRINAPSKNTVYAMAKAVFFKYNLNDAQDEYFRKMNAPNPLIHKRLCDIMQNFVWEWEVYIEKYKISE